jgi:hypothetical protein
MNSSTYKLLQRASWMAECLFKQRRGRFQTQLWLTERAGGRCERFETGCEVAPSEADDAAALRMLRADQAADFAYDHVVRFAVAYAARVTKTGCLLLRAPPQSRREAIVLEAHDDAGAHLVMVRDVIERERGFYLAAPEWVAAGEGRFGDLLPGVARDASGGAGPHVTPLP